MTWRAYFIETKTGLKGPEIEMSTNGRWDVRLNGHENCTVTVQKDSLRGIDREWWSFMRGGILLTFTTYDGVERPIIAGPIRGFPSEYTDSMSFAVGGIRDLLECRTFIGGGRENKRAPSIAEARELMKKSLTFTDSCPAYMAQYLTLLSMDQVGADLPIRIATPAPAKGGGHQRTFAYHKVAQSFIDTILTDLSDEEGGPDIMFRPEWMDANQTHIRWAMHTGNDVSPYIPQSYFMDIDTTSRHTPASEVSLEVGGEGSVATRVWATGDGEGSAIAVAVRESYSSHANGVPLIERHTSHQGVTELSTLSARAGAGVTLAPTVELHLSLDCQDERAPLGLWSVGDVMRVTVEDWFYLPRGTYNMRIIRAQGDLDSSHATLYLQED